MSPELKAMMAKIMEERDEIVCAFLAKHGCNPEDAEQVIRFSPEGLTWRVRKIENA